MPVGDVNGYNRIRGALTWRAVCFPLQTGFERETWVAWGTQTSPRLAPPEIAGPGRPLCEPM